MTTAAKRIEGTGRLGGAAPTFRDIIAAVQPHPDELQWQAIPWQTDLWEARRLALEVGRPIFLWAMNGNPLGCT